MNEPSRTVCDLVARYLEGSLEPAGRTELCAALAADPRVARFFAAELDLSMLLAESYEARDFAAHTVHEMLRTAPGPNAAGAFVRIAQRPASATRGQRPRTWRLPLAVAASLALALGLGGWLYSRARRAAEPPAYARLSSSAEVRIRRGTVSLRAGQDAVLREDDEIWTGPRAQAVLRYAGEQTEIVIGPDSTLRLCEQAGKRVDLSRGQCEATIARQPADRPMVFTTPNAVAKVVGTRLRLAVEPRSTRLDVLAGTVSLARKSDERSVLVRAGHYAEAREGRPLSPKPIPTTHSWEALPSTGGLREAAERLGIRLGCAVDYNRLARDPDYRATLAREFNTLTPENAQKWQNIHPGRDRYEFSETDNIVAFAEANGMRVHGHALVMRWQNPDWLKNGGFGRAELIEIMREHIHTVVGRYKGRIALWDVVNRAVEWDGTLYASVWLKTIGPEYIELAFRFAREADPDAHLIYNENDMARTGVESGEAVYALVRDLVKRGVPIDGVGFHMHIRPQDADLSYFARNMARFAALGLTVQVTQMDVRLRQPVTGPALARQAEVYRDVLDRCLKQPACGGFALWGFTDKHSWIQRYFPGYDQPLIIDDQGRPKPAYRALKRRLEQEAHARR